MNETLLKALQKVAPETKTFTIVVKSKREALAKDGVRITDYVKPEELSQFLKGYLSKTVNKYNQ
jgi:hypothetical protein